MRTACVVACLALTACSGSVAVDPPAPSQASVETACAALHAALPKQLAGGDQRATDPSSPLTAAWGDPAITLRCGTGRPPQLEPTSDLITVSGPAGSATVDWLPIELTNGYRFVSDGRLAYVEVDVPKAYAPEVNVLVPLSIPVSSTIPAT